MEDLRKQKKVLKTKFTISTNKFEDITQSGEDVETAERLYIEIKSHYDALNSVFNELEVHLSDDDKALEGLIEEQDIIKDRYNGIKKIAGEISYVSVHHSHNSDSDSQSLKSHERLIYSTPKSSQGSNLHVTGIQQPIQQQILPEMLDKLNLSTARQGQTDSQSSHTSRHNSNPFLPQVHCSPSTSKQPLRIPFESEFYAEQQKFTKPINTYYDFVPTAPSQSILDAPPSYRTFYPQLSTHCTLNTQNDKRATATPVHIQPVTHTQHPPYFVPQTSVYHADNNYQAPIFTNPMMQQQNLYSNPSQQMFSYPTLPPMMPVRLKPLELMQFNGEPHEWEHFRDSFEAMIHNAPMYDIEKFQRLQGLLKGGKAESFIKNMQVTSQNYQTVWNDLKAYYDNPRRIAMSHVSEMFSLKPIQNENPNSLRSVVDSFKNHLRGLQAARQSENVEIFQIQLLLSKLDEGTKSKWQSKMAAVREVPKLQDLYLLIEKRINSLEAIGEVPHPKKLTSTTGTFKKPSTTFKRNVYVVKSHENANCLVCDGEIYHQIYKCPKYVSAAPNEKLQIVKKHNLCHNCLRSGHGYKNCTSSQCREAKCKQKHHTSLHFALNNQKSETNCLTVKSEVQIRKKAMIATAIVLVHDRNGRPHKARVLLDGCSEDNFVTTALFQKLNLNPITESVGISGINLQSSSSTTTVNLNIKSVISEHTVNVNCIVMENIAENLPSSYINITSWDIPKSCKLADPLFNCPARVDMLLSADVFYGALINGQFKLDEDKPYLINTKFGWLVGGGSYSSKTVVNLVVVPEPVKSFMTKQTLSKQLEAFWTVESFPETKIRSQEDQQCEQLFKQTYKRDDNKFTVELPFKLNPSLLGDNLQKRAEALWLATERKFTKDERIQMMYNEFMKTYLQMGHMVETDPSKIKYFIPHHHVWKSNVKEEKFRVVFNASAKTSSGISLNEMLMIGPCVQDELINILIRFRTHYIVIAGDLEKMYRMVNLHENDQIYQGIVWRENPHEPLRYFKLCTLTYGTAPAAFLATRCLQEAANLDVNEFPIAANATKHDFYVDDFLSGAPSTNDAIKLRQEMQSFCKNNGFTIRKWVSNSKEVLDTIPEELKATDISLNFDLNETIKTLGLYWCPCTDEFNFITSEFSKLNTKRAILSDISKLFDPLGLLGPIVLSMKIFMQTLWKQEIEWDEEISPHLLQIWSRYKQEMAYVKDIRISRKVISHIDPESLQLFGFADACENGYGASIYLVSTNGNQVAGKLLCSKSRVAPLKTQSIPKLELCGALLLAELLSAVIKALSVNLSNVYAFTDSKIVLSWLSKEPSNWKVFVANRVAKIVDLIAFENWFHITSIRNPADVLSRGCTPKELKENQLWWNGPIEIYEEFILANHQSKQIEPKMEELFIIDSEKKTNVHAMVTETKSSDDIIELLLCKYSNLNLIIRIIAYIRRFLHNSCCKNINDRKNGSLSYEELTLAKQIMAKQAQMQYFITEINAIKRNKSLPNKSKLISLRPIWNEKLQCLTVGGRLENANISMSMKHPIILPEKSKFTKMLFKQEHENLLHAGPQLLLSEIRKKWWPVNGKRIATRVVHECVKCFKAKPKLQSQIMANLPSTRLVPTKPFLNCGVDFAGPIETLQHEGARCRVYRKSYFALFICLSTRAIHIETVSELSTDAFMAALHRFIARRGKIRNIYSDNGSNFIGTNNYLKQLFEFLRSKPITEAMSHQFEFIKWHFICVSSPHTGAIWESNIKSVKHHLHRVIGLTKLNFEQLTTLLTQIEACVNSRPICILSETPEEITPLTPGHFLTGDSMTTVPDYDYLDDNPNRLNKWCRIQYMLQDFWKAWHKEYIHTLQVRYKWQKESDNLKVNDLVLIKDDNLKPLEWKLGRVIKVFNDKEDKVRSAELLCNKHHTTRTVHKLCKLPLQDINEVN